LLAQREGEPGAGRRTERPLRKRPGRDTAMIDA